MKLIVRMLSIAVAASAITLTAAQVAYYRADGNALDSNIYPADHHDGMLGADVTYDEGRLGQDFSFPGTDTLAGKNVGSIPVSTGVSGSSPGGQQFLVSKQNSRICFGDYGLLKLPDGQSWFGADLGLTDEVEAMSSPMNNLRS